jgi:hypothetical protein
MTIGKTKNTTKRPMTTAAVLNQWFEVIFDRQFLSGDIHGLLFNRVGNLLGAILPKREHLIAANRDRS